MKRWSVEEKHFSWCLAVKFVRYSLQWLNRFNTGNTFQGFAMKVIMILSNLLPQNPSLSSKSKEHSKVLDERLNVWNKGKLNELLRDCKAHRR